MTDSVNGPVGHETVWALDGAYFEEAFKTLKPAAQGLFQLRKCGVIVTIPREVRAGMLAKHGAQAQEVLNLLDGNVRL